MSVTSPPIGIVVPGRSASNPRVLNETSCSSRSTPLIDQFYQRYRSFKANKAPAIDEEEIRSVFDFFDENHDGLISKDDLRHFMGRLGFLPTEEEIISMVSSVDVNADGNVDFTEFATLYEMMANDDTRSGSEGQVDDSKEDLKEAFHLFDKNADGVISPTELQEVLVNLGMVEGLSLRNCETMIRNVDSDGDGAVNFCEFEKLMSGDVERD